MNINYESYKILYTIATYGSITEASNVLHISQPAISWHLKNLESELGVTLFIRTKKGVTLTDEGRVFFDYIKTGIESFKNGENMLTNLKDLSTGSIRIGASTTVSEHVLMPHLEKFHEKYPNIEIEIVNALTEDLLTYLRNGSLDMLVLNMPMEHAKDIQIINCMDVQDIFVGNKKFFNETKGSIALKDLENYPLLFQKSPSNTRDYLDNYLKSNNTSLHPKMEIVSYNLIMQFVKSGFGIGYATKEFIKDDLKNNKLYEIKVTPEVPKRYIGIVTLKSSIPNYSTKKLIDIMTSSI